jgi:hypothetical protein
VTHKDLLPEAAEAGVARRKHSGLLVDLLCGVGAAAGVTGKDGQLCCGADDCSATVYRENGGSFEFLTREHTWVEIPTDRITFLPIPGDEIPAGETHRAHLCYRQATNFDRTTPYKRANVFGDIYLWCAFIPPGGV